VSRSRDRKRLPTPDLRKMYYYGFLVDGKSAKASGVAADECQVVPHGTIVFEATFLEILF